MNCGFRLCVNARSGAVVGSGIGDALVPRELAVDIESG
jgi:hypothetical protein